MVLQDKPYIELKIRTNKLKGSLQPIKSSPFDLTAKGLLILLYVIIFR